MKDNEFTQLYFVDSLCILYMYKCEQNKIWAHTHIYTHDISIILIEKSKRIFISCAMKTFFIFQLKLHKHHMYVCLCMCIFCFARIYVCTGYVKHKQKKVV